MSTFLRNSIYEIQAHSISQFSDRSERIDRQDLGDHRVQKDYFSLTQEVFINHPK